MKRFLAMSIVVLLAAGCRNNGYPGAGVLDPDRILHMAGEEAGQIKAVHQRLTRQLNIAHRQNLNGHPADARKTLVEARKTLEIASSKDMTDHQRLAGWISLSELSRGADDRVSANSALDQANTHLHELNPVNERCDYVLGVAREMRILRGDKESAKLIVESGEWALEIPSQDNRRMAYVSFTMELFRLEDYDGARGMLRRDPDPVWRSDTLTSISDQARSMAMFAKGGAIMANRPAAEARMNKSGSQQLIQQQYGKQLDFQSNYLKQD